MKFLILLIFSGFTSDPTHAAELSDWKGPNPIQCLKDHREILEEYEEQISSESLRILNGIRYEKENQTPQTAVRAYEQLAGKIFIKKMLAQNLVDQINSAIQRLNATKSPQVLFSSREILTTENIQLDRRLKLNQALDELTHEYIKELMIETGLDLGKGIYHAVSGNILKGITAASIGKASLSFGVHAIKGAGITFLLNLLTKPLKGARLPPETIWVEILEKNPELILNPEWMKEAGSPDAPWMTHCLALERKRTHIFEALETLVSNEENLFKSEVSKINASTKPVQIKTAAPADQTAVYNPIRSQLNQSEIPFWAITR
jgi:hypothetical protein